MTLANKIFKFLFIISITASLNFAYSAERVILHFDVNGTLIASDSVENTSSSEEINSLLAEKYVAKWDLNQKEEMTFHDYVDKVLAPEDKNKEEFKKLRKFYLHNFVSYLKTHKHPLYETVNQEYLIINNKLTSQKGKVFQSFYKLITFLESNNIEYSIFLRSFGTDIQNVANEIDSKFNRKFFDAKASFKNGELVTDNGVFTEPLSIYNYLKCQKNLIIQDDWQWWNSHGSSSKYSKKFYLKPQDDVVQIFFDDNIRRNSNEKNIIGPIDVDSNAIINIDSLIQSKKAVPVDTIKAITKDEYYIEYVMQSICVDPSISLGSG